MNEQESFSFQIFFFLFFTPHHILSFDRRVRNRISCLLLNNIYTCLKKILYFFISHEILWHGRTTRIINNNKYFDTHIFKKSWNLGRERRRKKFVESLGKSWRVKEHRRIIFKTLGNLAATFPGKSPPPDKRARLPNRQWPNFMTRAERQRDSIPFVSSSYSLTSVEQISRDRRIERRKEKFAKVFIAHCKIVPYYL